MAHVHIIVDHDKHFIIDPITKKIQPENPEKNKLVRYDHNSERYTFEMDRMLEGHDMSLCDIVQIHYINVSSNKQKKNEDIYEVNDLGLLSGNEDRIAFTWLVSRNATMLDGILTFAIRFACSNGDSIDYELHTEIFSSISISNTIINNGQSIVEEYSDILNQWKKELFGIEGTIQTAKRESLAAINQNRNESLSAIKSDVKQALERIDALHTNSMSEITNNKTESIKAIELAKTNSLEAIDRYGLVQVSEDEPSNPNIDVYIRPLLTETFTIPEIMDLTISPDDTWSSEKINAELNKVNDDVAVLKEDLMELQTGYDGMIKFQRGLIDGNEIKYNETRIAVTELPQKWVSVTANDGYDIRAAVYNASGVLLGYNLSENIWSERTIFKSTLKQLYPNFSYAWLQIRKNDDSSITLNDATKSISFIRFQLENKNYINALEYGFYNYGNIANDDVMDKYLKNDSDKELYFPRGVYLFKKRIEVINGCKIRMDSEAELKLSEYVGNIGGHFFIFGDKSKTKRGCYIVGGKINANFGTSSVVCLDSIQSARIENCILKNANQYGIQTGRTQDLRASDFYMHGCRIVNEKYVQGATGIFDNAYDNSFDNVTIVDFPIGIETASSKFNRVHAWLSSSTFIPNSIGIILDNNTSCFINCTIDTYHRGVISRGTKHYEFNSSNFTFFLNTNVYTKEIAAINPPVVFHQVVMNDSFTSLPILHCHGITINETGYDVKLADFEYSEDLLKKIWCSGVTQNSNIKNDAFTAEKRLYGN